MSELTPNQVFGRLFPKTLTLTASIYSRSLSTTSSPNSFLRRLLPLSGAVITSRPVLLPPSFRSLSTRPTIPSLIEQPSPNATSHKLRNGCDYYPRLVIMQALYEIRGEPTLGEHEPVSDEIIDSYVTERREFKIAPSMDEIIDFYVKMLAELVVSEDEARLMVYSGRTMKTGKYAFGTLLSKELSDRVKRLPEIFLILLSDPLMNDKAIDEIPIRLEQLEKLAGNALAHGEVI